MSPEAEAEAKAQDLRESYAKEFRDAPWYSKATTAAGDLLSKGLSGATVGGADWLAKQTGTDPAEFDKRDARLNYWLGPAAELPSVVGNVMGPGKLSTLNKPAIAGIQGLKGLAARTGIAGLEGSGWGGLNAFFNDQDIATGMAAGGLGGLASNVVLEPAQLAAALVARASRNARLSPEKRAEQAVANIIPNPSQAQADLANIGSEGALVDVLGRPGQRMARDANKRSDAANIAAEQYLVPRDELQPYNITQTISDLSGIPRTSAKSVQQLKDEAHALYSPQYRPLYNEAEKANAAMSMNVPASAGSRGPNLPDGFEDILDTPAGMKAWIQSHSNMQNWKTNQDRTVNSTFAHLDETRKILKYELETAKRKGDPLEAPLTQLYTDLTNRMDEVIQSPAYRKARELRAKEGQTIDAIDRGAMLTDRTIDLPQVAEAGKTPGDFQIPQKQGYAAALRERVFSNPTGPAIKRMHTPAGKQAIKSVYGPDAPQIERMLVNAQKFAQTNKKVLSNSSNLSEALMTYGLGGGGLISMGSGLYSGSLPSVLSGAAAFSIPMVRKAAEKAMAKTLEKQAPHRMNLLLGQKIPTKLPPSIWEKRLKKRLPVNALFGQYANELAQEE
jgi:hypothetical protein